MYRQVPYRCSAARHPWQVIRNVTLRRRSYRLGYRWRRAWCGSSPRPERETHLKGKPLLDCERDVLGTNSQHAGNGGTCPQHDRASLPGGDRLLQILLLHLA